MYTFKKIVLQFMAYLKKIRTNIFIPPKINKHFENYNYVMFV